MFDQMKAMGALAGLMKNRDRIKQAGEELKARLETTRVVGQAGGGAVRVTVSGRMRVERVEFDPAMAGAMGDEASRLEAQRLTVEAVNDALASAEAVVRKETERMARELGLDDLPGAEGLTKMLGS